MFNNDCGYNSIGKKINVLLSWRELKVIIINVIKKSYIFFKGFLFKLRWVI